MTPLTVGGVDPVTKAPRCKHAPLGVQMTGFPTPQSGEFRPGADRVARHSEEARVGLRSARSMFIGKLAD